MLGFAFSVFASFTVAVTWGTSGALVTSWGGFGDGRGSAGPDNTPTTDNVVPFLGQVHLLRREPEPLRFRARRLLHGGCPTNQGGSLFRKGCLSLFPFHTATGDSVCGCPHKCSTEAAPGGPGSQQKDETPHTRRTVERVCSYAHMTEALAAF